MTHAAPMLPERLFYALVFRAERDPRARRVVIASVRAFFRLVAAERRRGGTRLLDLARLGAIRFARYRAPILRDRLGLADDAA